MTYKHTRRGFTQSCYAKGFTLIELLVGVLIIGVLAAVAMPQYQRAVEKSHITEAFVVHNHLRQAIDLFLLERGYPAQGTMNFLGNNANARNTLSIKEINDLDCTQNVGNGPGSGCGGKYFVFDAACNNSYCAISARRFKNGDSTNTQEYLLVARKDKSSNTWTRGCYGSSLSYSQKLCKILEKQGWCNGKAC